jgi:hypothetical protein
MTKEASPPDLAAFDTTAACDRGFELELVNPITKEPLGSFITVVGKDSTAFTEHTRRVSNATLRRQFERQRKGKDGEPVTIEKIEAEAIDLLVACTTGWRNISYNKEPLPFSEENARKLYTEQKWVRAQVDEAIGDLENFIPA